jgi:SAM-dependent methyltransferase
LGQEMKAMQLQQGSSDIGYVCPRCKHGLTSTDSAFQCQVCGRLYPIEDEIPDFIPEDLKQSEHPVLRSVSNLDRLARVYESKLWYPVVYRFYGGLFIPSVKKEVCMITEMVDSEKGVVLDVACGTGLFTRSIAKKARLVYGVDISKGMLEQAVKYRNKENLSNIRFARAKAENLPFPDSYFDGLTCCGALHLFADTMQALMEMSRVMKHESRIAVMTFVNRRIFRFERIREHLRKEHGAIIFDVEDLNMYLGQAGFMNFNYQVYGSAILFEARKT